MRQSSIFNKTLKEAPKDEVSASAQLLIRGGFIYKNLSGVYSFLYLGNLVLQKIVGIVRTEMESLGANEILLGALQDPTVWEKTKRWDDKNLDVWFKTRLKNETEVGFATTHEEPLAELLAHYVSSYKDLPLYFFQFQTKFRNELRPRGGLLRTREFLMKDLYSFSRTQDELDEFYEKVASSYLRIFEGVGLGKTTYRTFASGGAFSKFSDEFQTVCDAGEDTIYIDKEKGVAVNKEVYKDDILDELGLSKKSLEETKAIEVGNIFKLGTRFSEPLGLLFEDSDGSKKPVVMGSYGIGPARVMGTIVEIHHDEKGIIWPENVAPFRVHLLLLGHEDSVTSAADRAYQELVSEGIEVLYDDRRDISAGEKFAEADLIGLPFRAVVSKRSLEENSVEIKKRSEDKAELVSISNVVRALKAGL